MWERRKYPFFIFDLIVYILLNTVLLYFLHPLLPKIQTISLFEFILFGMAVYRVAYIISNETVTKPIRAPFVDLEKEHGEMVEEPKKDPLLGSFGTLIYCPSCVGVWIATLGVYSYLLFPDVTRIIILIFALSTMERILTPFVGMIEAQLIKK